jgi:hypothetical protein
MPQVHVLQPSEQVHVAPYAKVLPAYSQSVPGGVVPPGIIIGGSDGPLGMVLPGMLPPGILGDPVLEPPGDMVGLGSWQPINVWDTRPSESQVQVLQPSSHFQTSPTLCSPQAFILGAATQRARELCVSQIASPSAEQSESFLQS